MSTATQAAVKRIQKELKAFRENPMGDVEIAADPENILTVYFCLDGSKGTPYEGGEYYCRMQLPSNYPFAAPSFYMMTPSGRFQTETSICTSFSAYHQSTWSPSWSAGTMASGLLSFMATSDATAGSITSSDETKRTLAAQSRAFNAKQPMYRKLFPNRLKKGQEMAEAAEAEKEKASKVAAAAAVVAEPSSAVASDGALQQQQQQVQQNNAGAGAAAVAVQDNGSNEIMGKVIAAAIVMIAIGIWLSNK